MANTKISAFTSGSPAQTTDEFVIARTGANFKLAGSDIKTLAVGAGSVSVASGKTLTASNTLTLAGTDSTTMTFPSTSATLARTDAGNTFTGNQTVNGGTITADAPVLNMSQTWNNAAITFTGLKLNATDTASNAASLLMDLQTGGVSRLSLTKAGTLTFAGNLQVANNAVYIEGTAVGTVRVPGTGGYYGFTTNTASTSVSTIDTFITRRAAANLRLGAADAAAPVAQTLSVQSGTAGASATTVSISGTALTIAGTITGTIAIGHAVTGTGVSAGTLITAGSGTSWTVNNSQTVGPITAYFNSVGRDFTITGNQGSGPSAGGSIIFQVAPAGSAATTAQNALATALTINSSRQLIVPNTTNTPIGGAAACNYGLGSSAYGIYGSTGDNSVGLSSAGNPIWHYTPSVGWRTIPSAYIGWATDGFNTAADTILAREAAGITGVRGANTTTGGALGFIEQTAPAAPAANGVRIYAVDNGSGKTQLMALFGSGVAQQIAIEP